MEHKTIPLLSLGIKKNIKKFDPEFVWAPRNKFCCRITGPVNGAPMD